MAWEAQLPLRYKREMTVKTKVMIKVDQIRSRKVKSLLKSNPVNHSLLIKKLKQSSLEAHCYLPHQSLREVPTKTITKFMSA